ncbi:MAG TPA: DUF554 domain-containing protein [Clostridiaceae bacterium]|nr:DUF554 domain-containing protein [Clostridiaceae bacterium]
MIGTGTIVNVAVVIAGGFIGSFIKRGLPERYKNIVVQAIGLSVFIIGISGTLQGMYKVIDGGNLDRQYLMTMIFSLIIGGLAGELINIEDKLDKIGIWFQNKFSREGGNFAQGFVTASLIFCVGAMAVVGSLEDGLTGNPSTLFAKSILDGVMAVILASTMGIGVAFSAIPVLVYQGSITLLAGLIKPLLTDTVVSQMSMVGSILILGIGINILEIKKIKVGNLLPALFVPLAYYMIILLWKTILGLV